MLVCKNRPWRGFQVVLAVIVAPMRASHLLAASLFFAGWILPIAAVEKADKSDVQFADIIALVRQRGWPTDLARFCPALGLKLNGAQCVAQQIAFSDQGRNRAFNLIPLRPGAVTYVVIIDLTADEGTVYLASGNGELISTATISLRSEGKQISTEAAQKGFQQELAFWAANVGQFDKWLEKRKYGPAPKSETTN